MPPQGLSEWVSEVDDALLAEMTSFEGRLLSPPSPFFSSVGLPVLNSGLVNWSKVGPSLGPLGFGFQLLRMMCQDDSLLDFLGSDMKGPLCKEMVVNTKEMEPSKAMECSCDMVGEKLISDSLFSKFANFSSFVGMPITGFEKEINSFMRKMEARKGLWCWPQGQRGNLSCHPVLREKSNN